MNNQDDNEDEHLDACLAEMKDLIWLLARKARCDSQKIPSWTSFNIMTQAQDVISYLPSINGPATQLTTVNEILRQSDGIRKALDLKEIVVVMDQALYAKASWFLFNTGTPFYIKFRSI